jgi:hypothetical protein
MQPFDRILLGDGAREWWPAESNVSRLVEGRVWPADWIGADRQRRFMLDRGDGTRRRVRIGETVPFLWRECRAGIEATIDGDGGLDMHGSVPRDATHFWIEGEEELAADTIEDLAALVGAMGERLVRVRIRMCRWSPRPVGMRLHLSGGKPVLVPAAAGDAARLAG